LLSKTLNSEIWDSLKEVKDEYGFTLHHLINSGIENMDVIKK
jgi:hypothetical protein